MRPYRSGEGPLDAMIELLVANSQAPPKEVKGVSQGFLDGEWDVYSWEELVLAPLQLECDGRILGLSSCSGYRPMLP